MKKQRTPEPQAKMIDGRLAFIARSGKTIWLDDFDSLRQARRAAMDLPPDPKDLLTNDDNAADAPSGNAASAKPQAR